MAYGFSRYLHNGLKRLNYAELKAFVDWETPYRRENDRISKSWPLGPRRDSHKHLRLHDDGSISLWYGNRLTVDEHAAVNYMREEFDEMDATWEALRSNPDRDAKFSHMVYNTRNKLGVIHPDNTFEFLNVKDQGDAMFLSCVLRATVKAEARRGGMMFYGKNDQVHPIYRGLRINLETHEAVSDYTVRRYKVNRSGFNKYKKFYDEYIKVSTAMVSQMDNKGVLDLALDVTTEIQDSRDKQPTKKDFNKSEAFVALRNYIDNKDYLGGLVMFAVCNKEVIITAIPAYQTRTFSSQLWLAAQNPQDTKIREVLLTRAGNIGLSNYVKKFNTTYFNKFLIGEAFDIDLSKSFIEEEETKGKLFATSTYPIIVIDKSIDKIHRL